MASRKKARPVIISATTEERRFGDIRPNPENPRDNSEGIGKLVESIRKYGYNDYMTIRNDGLILAGHTRYEALKILGMDDDDMVKVHVASHLTDTEGTEYSLVDNKSAEYSGWNFEKLEFVIEEYGIRDSISEWFPPVEEADPVEFGEGPVDADEDVEVPVDDTEVGPRKKSVVCPCCGTVIEL